MATIAELLKEYSKENAEISPDETPNVDESSILEEIVEADVISDMDEEEGVELDNEITPVHDTIDILVDASESLENSINFLTKVQEVNGSLDDTSIRLFNASIVESLESRGISPDILGDDVTFSFESTSSEEKKEEKKVGFFRRIWEMIKAAFQRMREWITRFFAWFRTSGSVVKSAAEKLKKVAEEKKKNKATAEGKKFNQAPFTDLQSGANIDPVKAVKDLQTVSDLILASAASMVEESAKVADVLVTPKVDPSFWSKIKGMLSKSKEHYAKALSDMVKNPLTSAMPGGRKLLIEVHAKKRGFRATVKIVKDTSVAKPKDRWAPVMSLDEIIRLADDIIALVDKVDKGVEKFNKTVENSKVKEVNVIKVDAEEVGSVSNDEIREMTSMIAQGMAVSNKLVTTLGKLVFPIAKRAYAYGAVNVRQYK